MKEYERQETNTTGSRYPSTIVLEDALDINSTLWHVLDDDVDLPSQVPFCIKRQLIDLNHIRKRCKEEKIIIKEEMSRMLSYYEGKVEKLEAWSKELAVATESIESRGCLSIALTKIDELRMFTRHLHGLFSSLADENPQVLEGQEPGILVQFEDTDEDNDVQGEVEESEDDISQQLGETEIFEELRAVLYAEYGSDDESDSYNSDSDTD